MKKKSFSFLKKSNLLVISFLLSSIVLTSCQQKPDYQNAIDKKVNKISSIASHQFFLNQIYNDSQGILDSIETLRLNYLKNLKTINLLNKKKDCLMIINRYKVSRYLENFDYPTDSIYSDIERDAIYYGIYNDINTKFQLNNFDLLYNLYKNGNLEDRKFLRYLGRIYYLKNGKFLNLNNNLTISQMIEETLSTIIQLKSK